MGQPQEQITSDELERRLRPAHLENATAEGLKDKVAQETQGPPPQSPEDEAAADPRAQNPYGFEFQWTDHRGKAWTGRFVTHMPTPLDLIRAGVMQARLLASQPKDSLDAFTDEIAFMVSRLSFVLDERPDWFKDPLNMVDAIPLIQRIYEEVASFEAFFRRNGKVESKGA